MSRTVSDSPLRPIPSAIAARLRALTRRARAVAAARGAAYTLGAFLVGMAAAIAVDLFVPMLWPASAMWFTPATRVALSGAVLGASLTIAGVWLIRPLRRRYSLTAAALTLERDHPELQERISSTVQLMLSRDPAVFRGSERMIGQVALAAEADSARVSPRQVIRTHRARRAWLLAGLIVAGVVVAAAWQPRYFSLYVQRFVAPWNDTAQFRRTSVESITADREAARGERLVVEARCGGLFAQQAVLYVTWSNGRSEPFTVHPQPNGGDGQTFLFPFDNVTDSFTYRIRANDGVTAVHRITAVDRPQVGPIDLLLDYPDYTARSSRLVENGDGTISAVRFTRATVRATLNRSIDTDAGFLVATTNPPPTTRPDADRQPVVRRLPLTLIEGTTYQADLTVDQPGTYAFELTSGQWSNLPRAQPYRIAPEPDALPRVRQLSPTADVTLRPDDKLLIGYEASDDYGLARLEVLWSLDGRTWQAVGADLPADAARSAHARAEFDLSALNLSAATQVKYKLRVHDNLPARFAGPQWSETSPPRTIRLDVKVADYEAQLAETLREVVADSVKDLDAELRAALADVKAVQKAMVRQPVLDPAQTKHTESAGGHLDTALELARSAAQRTDLSQYERLGERLAGIASAHIQPARKLTGQSLELANQPDPRKDKLGQAEWHIERALEKLSAVGKEFTDLIALEDRTAKLMEMAEKQEHIAEQAEDKPILDPKELAELSKEQMELLEQARKMLAEQKAEAAEPLFDVAAKAEETLQEKIGQVVAEQKELMEETARGQELSDLEKKAADLARRQGELAKATEAFEKAQAKPLEQAKAPADADKPMTAAADQIARGEFPQAAQSQTQAIDKLQQAEQKTEQHAVQAAGTPAQATEKVNQARRAEQQIAQLAARARQLAEQQQAVARETAAAVQPSEQAAQKADAARQAADRQLAVLAKRQEQIAAKAEQLQKDAAAKLTAADAQSARQHDAAPPARQAAAQIQQGKPSAAAPAAQQAEQKAAGLAKAMDQAAAAHAQAAAAADQQAAAATDDAARQAAQAEAARQRQQSADAKQIANDAVKLAADQAAVNRELPRAQQTVATAEQAAAAAREAAKPLSAAAAKQKAIAAAADQLGKQLAQAGEPARKLAQQHNAAAPAADAAAKLPDQPRPAAAPQAQAAKALDELAKGLEALKPQAAAQTAQAVEASRQAQTDRQAAAQAAALKKRQQQLADETGKLAEQFDQARRALGDRQLADLVKKQEQLAEQAGQLSDQVARQPADEQGNPQPDQPNANAVRAAAAADQAAGQLAQGELPKAVADQRQAAGELEKLAGEMARQAAEQAGVDPQAQQLAAAQAQAAGQLAQRQRQLADQVANLVRQNPLANLPARQQALREQTEDLGRQAGMVADFLEQLAPQAGQLARQAAQQLAERAPAAQRQAEQAMGQRQLPAARQAQQQAAAAAERAGELFNRAAEQAAAAAPNQPPDGEQLAGSPDEQGEPGEPGQAGQQGQPGEEPNPFDPLAKAAWAQAQAQAALRQAAAARQAQQQLAQALAQAQAAAAAREAGQQLAQAAGQMGRQVISLAQSAGGQPGEQTRLFAPAWVSERGTMGGAPDMRMLNFELGLTPAEWNRLPGYIQQEVLQATGEKVPQEYRELIKRYFQTISRQTGQP